MKYNQILTETEELFKSVLEETSIPRSVTFELVSADDLKEVGKVVKGNDLFKYMTKVDVVIILNEAIFDRLDDEQKRYILEELLATVHVDMDSSKLKLLKPDIETFSLLLKRYGIDFYMKMKEEISAIANELEASKE
jgi:hypothetical protein